MEELCKIEKLCYQLASLQNSIDFFKNCDNGMFLKHPIYLLEVLEIESSMLGKCNTTWAMP
jgi:hypothetical protein